MILLIDNYDSFSYNLYQLIGSVEPEVKVIRNDDCTLGEIEAMQPEALILSPGPGRPEDAGICIPAIRYFAGKLPILGVCLGHQAICEAFGGTVSYAKQLMHGKQKEIRQCAENRLFRDLPETFSAARYHSLALCVTHFRRNFLLQQSQRTGKSWQWNIRSFRCSVYSFIRNRS